MRPRSASTRSLGKQALSPLVGWKMTSPARSAHARPAQRRTQRTQGVAPQNQSENLPERRAIRSNQAASTESDRDVRISEPTPSHLQSAVPRSILERNQSPASAQTPAANLPLDPATLLTCREVHGALVPILVAAYWTGTITAGMLVIPR